MKRFDTEWWQDKKIAVPWCEEFCDDFVRKHPSFGTPGKAKDSLGVVFFNTEKNEIVPVGTTGIEGTRFIFQYHPSYLARQGLPAISTNLPKRAEAYESDGHMLPFFDNLPAEGWFGKAQGQALGQEALHINGDTEALDERYHRLMMFGRDCPGAVWATYARIDPAIAEDCHQAIVQAALRSRASLSGVQPKMLAVIEGGKLRPTNYWETSTHIVKMAPTDMTGLVEYEYMSALATKHLLPRDKVVDVALDKLYLSDGNTRDVLSISRFDRTKEGGKIHFEEINQIAKRQNHERYDGSYSDIAHIIEANAGHPGVKQFYSRLLVQFLLGNVDNHFKNFAMFANDNHPMTPDYDLAPSANYKARGTMALRLSGVQHRMRDGSIKFSPATGEIDYKDLDAKKLVTLGVEFGLSIPEIQQAANEIMEYFERAKQAVCDDSHPQLDTKLLDNHGKERKTTYRQDFCDRMDGRRKQLFGTMNKYLACLETKQGYRGVA